MTNTLWEVGKRFINFTQFVFHFINRDSNILSSGVVVLPHSKQASSYASWMNAISSRLLKAGPLEL
jgi:hypothetical protein